MKLGYGESKKGAKAEKRPDPDSGGSSTTETEDREPNLVEFLASRVFRFLHYYSGERDPLGTAIHAEANKRGMDVKVTSCEKENGVDLLKAEPFKAHCDLASQGHWDGFHAGFPCTSFSRLRWRQAVGYRGPAVRSRTLTGYRPIPRGSSENVTTVRSCR